MTFDCFALLSITLLRFVPLSLRSLAHLDGFRKITHIENTGLKVENDEIEFYHSYFLKGQENLLEYIKRKVTHSGPII